MTDPKSDAKRYSLEDVLEVGAESIRSSFGANENGSLDFATIDEVIQKAGSTLHSAPADGAAMVSPVDVEDEGGNGIGAFELEQLVAILETDACSTALADSEAPLLECASILLHEAHNADVEGAGSDSVRTVAQRVETSLRGVSPERVTPFLQTALWDMAETHSHASFDVWMQAASPMLRRAVPFLLDRMMNFAIEASPHGRAAMWPYVVDEFLMTLQSRVADLDPRIHVLEPDVLAQACERLAALQALGKGHLAPGGFKIAQTFAHSIVIRLMQSPASRSFGPILFAAFRETPPADPGARACVLASRWYDDSIGWILTQQLMNVRAFLSGEAERAAAWVLFNAIEQLEPDRRTELWIPEALEWLGFRDMSYDPDEQFDPTRSLFEGIAMNRRGLRYVWNRECRSMARDVLRNGGFA